MRKFLKQEDFFWIVAVLFGLLFVYRGVFLAGKIPLPSNFLAQFYSPWTTQKFALWEAGIPHKPIGTDQIRFLYPAKNFNNQMLKKGEIPLWNPYIFSGAVHLADFQSTVFYPLNFVYAILSQVAAWSVLIIIQPVLAFFFMYLFLNLFSLSRLAIFLGAFSFGFSGFMIVLSQENSVVSQAGLWLPLVLFAIESLLRTNKIQYLLILSFALASSFLGGFFQITFYAYALAFFYSIFRIRQIRTGLRIKPSLLLVAGLILAFLLVAFQLIPSIEGFLNSPRPVVSIEYLFKDYLLPVTHFFNALAPDIFGSPGAYNFFGRGFYHETILYIGSVPFIFAIFAFLVLKKDKIVRFFVFSAFISFFLTLNSFFTRWFFKLPIPLLPTFLPSRILFLTAFSLSVLAAFGISAWISKKDKKQERILNLLLLVFFVIFLVFFSFAAVLLFFGRNIFTQNLVYYVIKEGFFPIKKEIVIMIRNLIPPLFMTAGLFFLIKARSYKKIHVYGLLILTVLGQFYFFNKYVVLGDKQFLYPGHFIFDFLQEEQAISYERFIAFGKPIIGNISTIENLYSPEGMDPLFPFAYGQLVNAGKYNGLFSKNIPRIEATLSELEGKERLLDNQARLKLLSLLGVRYLLYFDDPKTPQNEKIKIEEKFPPELVRPLFKKDNWHFFEYIQALPRAFFADNVVVEKDPEKIFDLIFAPSFDLSKNIILEENPTENISKKESDDYSVDITRYEPQKIEIRAKTKSPKMLFLSDNYYPGWIAFLDGEKSKIYRSNFTFRAVLVPEGEHLITFAYKPLSFMFGAYLSLAGIFIFALLVFLSFKKK